MECMSKRKGTLMVSAVLNKIYFGNILKDGNMSDSRQDMTDEAIEAVATYLKCATHEGQKVKGLGIPFKSGKEYLTLIPEDKWEAVKKLIWEKETTVVAGFPGVGKSHMFRNPEGLTILDSDSSKFSWVEGKEGEERHPDFPANYIAHIKENIGKVDVIFVSTHVLVRRALAEAGIDFNLVYPNADLKSDYMKRYEERGSDAFFLALMDEKFDEFIADVELLPYTRNIFTLGQRVYVSDIMDRMR